jgi:hypothetical protein
MWALEYRYYIRHFAPLRNRLLRFALTDDVRLDSFKIAQKARGMIQI